MNFEYLWVLVLVVILIGAVVVVVIEFANKDWHPEETCGNQCDSLNLSFYNWEKGSVFTDSQCFCLNREGYPIEVGR